MVGVLILLLINIYRYVVGMKGRKVLKVSRLSWMEGGGFWKREVPWLVQILGLLSLVLGLGRPQLEEEEVILGEGGIEIMLVMDTSISMWFVDVVDEGDMAGMKGVGLGYIQGEYRPVYQKEEGIGQKRRIEIAKKVIQDFIGKRKKDKIGLVIFKARSTTISPPILGSEYLKGLVDQLSLSMVSKYDGTAIGDALGTTINAFNHSKSKNKVMILVTDGNDNQEEKSESVLSYEEVLELAEGLGIKIYTIGMGGEGRVFAPYVGRSWVLNYEDYEKTRYFIEYGSEQINEKVLRKVASRTGGKFYRGTNEEDLENIYRDIDRLEKTQYEGDIFKRKKELYEYFVYAGLGLMVLGLSLKYGRYRVLP